MDVRRVLGLQGLLYINCVAGLHETELLETLRNLEKTRYFFQPSQQFHSSMCCFSTHSHFVHPY